jgi:flagellar hook protein FlgE
MSISDSMYTALSGMQAASAQMNIAASNIANMHSVGYQALRANLNALPANAGVSVGSVSADPSQGPVDQNGQQSSNVDLTTEVINMSMAKNLYTANAVAFRVSSQMTGGLLDIIDNSNDHPG